MHSISRLIVLFCLSFVFSIQSKAALDTVYVNINASGLNNGDSWVDAYTDLAVALSNENDDAIFLIAQGTYKPHASDPNASFVLKSGQQLFGGFATGDFFHQRDHLAKKTILSGDLNANSAIDFGVDSKIIVIGLNLTNTIVLNGLEITGAVNSGSDGAGVYLNNSPAEVVDCIIYGNEAENGAGLYFQNSAGNLDLIRCKLYNNTATTYGGAVFISGNASARNNILHANSANLGGAAFLYTNGGLIEWVNNTAVDNLGGVKGILYQSASGGQVQFRNSIIWNNEFAQFDGTNVSSPNLADVFNCISPALNLSGQNNNLNSNPDLDNAFAPKKCSPSLDAGNNTFYTSLSSDNIDFRAQNRFFDGNYDFVNTIDIGAIESDIICEACTTTAGPDQSVCALSTTLAAKAPGYQRSGQWILVSGPGTATFTNASLFNTSVSVSVQGSYVFRWTLSGTDCSVSDEVSIQFSNQPAANAGADKNFCGLSGTLAAQASTGAGQWSALTGGVSFANNTLPNTLVTVSNAGTYSFVWTESNGACTVSRDTMLAVFNTIPTPNAGNDTTICSFNFNLKGVTSVGNAQWSLSSGSGTANISNPASPTSAVSVTAAGSYTFRLTETNSPCSAVFDEVVYTIRQQPIANAGLNIDTCGNVAQLRALPSAGTGLWSFVSGPGSALFNQSNNPNSTVAVSSIGQYIFRWTETNGASCQSSSSDVLVDFSSATQVFLQNIGTTYCDPNDELKMQININGIAPFTFVVESPYRKDTISTNLSSLVYSDSSVTKGASQVNIFISKFVDGNGCPGVISNNLISYTRRGPDLQPGLDGFYANNDTICSGNNAILTLNYFNNEPLTFYIEDVAKQSTFQVNYTNGILNVPVSNLVYGLNRFRITSVIRGNGGCEMGIKGMSVVDIINKPVSFNIQGSDLTCFESNDGAIGLSANTGVSDWTKVFLNGVQNNNLLTAKYQPNLPAGSYVVRVLNAAGCELSKSKTLVQPGPINYSYTIKNVTCKGLSNGNVDIFTTGGYGSLSIHFNGFVEKGPFKFTGLAAGKYPVKITDDITGCIVFGDTVRISEPDSFKLQTIVANVNCDGTNNGSITLVPSGGTPPYSGNVSLGGFQYNVPSFSSTAKVGELKQGYYTSFLIDKQGCQISVKDTIRQGTELIFNAFKVKDFDCGSGGTLAVSGQANVQGTLYSIDGVNFSTDTIWKQLNAGFYTVYGKTPAGCIRGYDFEIKNNNQPFIAQIAVLQNITCFNGNNGKIKIAMNGGSGNYRIIYNGGIPQKDSVFDNLGLGPHNFTVIDIGCGLIINLSYTFTNPDAFVARIDKVVNPSCSYSTDGSLRLSYVGGNAGVYQFSVNGGQSFQYGNQFNNLGKGVYNIVVKDGIGCNSLSLPTQLIAPDSLIVNASFANNFSTRTSDITLSATGGTPQYLYSINSTNFTVQNQYNNVPFAYISAEVIDANGCKGKKILALGDVGIGETLNADLIDLYPNPARDQITLRVKGAIQPERVKVYNSLGQLFLDQSFNGEELNVSQWPSGLYQLHIESKQGLILKTFVIE